MTTLEDRIVEYIPRLRRYARALMRNDSLAADDLVQDTLERALSKLHRWRRGSDLRAWLFTIMHNLYANHVRRAVNSPRFIELQDSNEKASTDNLAESSVALREISQALASLSHDQREILLLVSLEGLHYHEVARILNIPEGTVMSRLSRARNKLRSIMQSSEEIQDKSGLWRIK